MAICTRPTFLSRSYRNYGVADIYWAALDLGGGRIGRRFNPRSDLQTHPRQCLEMAPSSLGPLGMNVPVIALITIS